MDLKEKLIYLRKQRKLSQQDLAEHLDISRQTISKWEQGALPSSDNLYQLAKLYGVSTDALLNDELSVELMPAPATAQPQVPPPPQPEPNSAGHGRRAIAALVAVALLCGILLGIAMFAGTVKRGEEEHPIKDLEREMIDDSEITEFYITED